MKLAWVLLVLVAEAQAFDDLALEFDVDDGITSGKVVASLTGPEGLNPASDLAAEHLYTKVDYHAQFEPDANARNTGVLFEWVQYIKVLVKEEDSWVQVDYPRNDHATYPMNVITTTGGWSIDTGTFDAGSDYEYVRQNPISASLGGYNCLSLTGAAYKAAMGYSAGRVTPDGQGGYDVRVAQMHDTPMPMRTARDEFYSVLWRVTPTPERDDVCTAGLEAQYQEIIGQTGRVEKCVAASPVAWIQWNVQWEFPTPEEFETAGQLNMAARAQGVLPPPRNCPITRVTVPAWGGGTDFTSPPISDVLTELIGDGVDAENAHDKLRDFVARDLAFLVRTGNEVVQKTEEYLDMDHAGHVLVPVMPMLPEGCKKPSDGIIVHKTLDRPKRPGRKPTRKRNPKLLEQIVETLEADVARLG